MTPGPAAIIAAESPLAVDRQMLWRFEAGLDPLNLSTSPLPARLIGFGEISAIFVIDAQPEVAYKRMPLFTSIAAAEAYGAMHADYCRHLRGAGLRLPVSASSVVAVPGRPVVLYIAQRRLPEETLAHRQLHRLSTEALTDMIAAIVSAINGIWEYNRRMAPAVAIGIDGQVSNWAMAGGLGQPALTYIDTSTPLLRIGGREQLDPELLLKSAPVFLRWLLRWCFVADVVNRYYDPHSVLVDLIANLYKEQRPDLVPPALAAVNRCRLADTAPLEARQIRSYYRQDRLIWQLFLAFRRLDRWLSTRVLGRRYDFILPGRIRR